MPDAAPQALRPESTKGRLMICQKCREGDTQSTKGHCYGVTDDECICWCTGGPGERDSLDFVEKAIAYRPQAGDVLFLECDYEVSQTLAERLQHDFKAIVAADVKVVILAKGMRVSVVHEAAPVDKPDGMLPPA